jgi:hypothetical protein
MSHGVGIFKNVKGNVKEKNSNPKASEFHSTI